MIPIESADYFDSGDSGSAVLWSITVIAYTPLVAHLAFTGTVVNYKHIQIYTCDANVYVNLSSKDVSDGVVDAAFSSRWSDNHRQAYTSCITVGLTMCS